MGDEYEFVIALTKQALLRIFYGVALFDTALRTALVEISHISHLKVSSFNVRIGRS